MQVGAIGGSSPAAGGQTVGQKDPQSDAIRKQIEETKKQMRSVAQSESLTPEEKLEKQKELRERLTDLQQQLSQRQRDLRQEQREAREQRAASSDRAAQRARPAEERTPGAIGPDAAQSLLGQSTQLDRAERLDRVVLSLEGRARVLQSEIRQDASASESKQGALSELQSRIKGARSAAGDGLLKLNRDAAGRGEKDAAEAARERETPAEAARHALEKERGEEKREDGEIPS